MITLCLTCLCFATDPYQQLVQQVDDQQTIQKDLVNEKIKQDMLTFINGTDSTKLPAIIDFSLLTPVQQRDFNDRFKDYISSYLTTGWNYLGAYTYSSVVSNLNSAGLDPENVKMGGGGSSIIYVYYYEP